MSDNKEFLIRVKADIKQAISELKQVSTEINKTGTAASKSQSDVKGLGNQFGYLKSAVAGYLSFQFAKKILLEADAYNVLQQRIKTATKDTGDYVSVSRELFDISQRNGAQLEISVSLFQGLARSANELKATNKEMLTLTNLVEQLGVISGASKANQQAGLLQFSQGLAAGVFRAEEFNSLLENIPELANRMAKGLGKSTGELRQLVLDGQLLSKDVFDALLKQAPEIAREFEGIPISLERAGARLGTTFDRLISQLDDALGLTNSIAEAMVFWSETLDGNPLEDQRKELEKYRTQLKHTTDQIALLQDLVNKGDDASILDKASAYLEFGAIKVNSLEKINALLNKLKGQSADVRQEMQALIDDITGANDAASGDDKNTTEDTGQSAEDAKKIQEVINALQLQAETFGQTKEQIALYKLELLGADAAQLELAKNAITSIDAQNKANEIGREAAKIYADTRTEQENLADSLSRLDTLLKTGAIDWDTYSRAVFDTNESFSKVTEKGKDSMDELIAATRGWGKQFTNTLADMVQKGKLDFSSLADSIISDLLRIQIQQTITTPLLASFGFSPSKVGTNHTGGMAGTGATKYVNPAVFLNAPRYHTGGIAGLSSNEVPAILQKNEEVLTRDDPRHRYNQGGSQSVKVEVVKNGSPINTPKAESSFDADGMVVKLFLDDMERGGPMSARIDSKIRNR